MIEVELSPLVKTVMAAGPEKTEGFIRRLILMANRLEVAAFKMASMDEAINRAELAKQDLFDFIKAERSLAKEP